MMWWWGHEGRIGAAGWVGMAFMIIFWIAVVIGIAYLIRYLAARPSGGAGHESTAWRGPGTPAAGPAKPDALQMLEERYAKGEIDREEFLQRRSDLLGK